jgi:hypothetical protein
VIRYSARAISWPLTGIGCTLVAGLMSLVGAWPYIMWPLQGTALGVVAGTVSWSMDERCADLVDTLPRPLWWRTAARSIVAVPVLSVWVCCQLIARTRIPQHLGLFVVQGFGMTLAALALATWLRSTGMAQPGRQSAAIVIPTAAVVALARPVIRWLPIFPVWSFDNWALSRTLWTIVCAASATLLLLALATDGRDRAGWATRRPNGLDPDPA